jgi:hypothetical protein
MPTQPGRHADRDESDTGDFCFDILLAAPAARYDERTFNVRERMFCSAETLVQSRHKTTNAGRLI